MTAINGIPAHALLVHAIVVLAPLTALLEILCAFWPAARRRLVWLVLALAAITLVLTPLTTKAGEWLYNQLGNTSPILEAHRERGAWMIYFSAALLIVAIALAVLHLLEGRSDRRKTVATIVVAIVALVVGVSSIVGVVRIGDAGAEAVWGRQSWSNRAGPTLSGLLERLDRHRDGDLVADNRSAGLQRHVDVDAEVLAVQHD
jgi:ABC-type uncharacterized transport system permease subunit